MRIDVHAHYWPARYLDLLEASGSRLTGLARNLGAGGERKELEGRFRMLEAAEIDLQVVSTPAQVPYFLDPPAAVAAARLANDLSTELVERFPDRFRAFAVTPLPHIEASLKELGRALDELGMVGIAITTTVLGRSLADPAWAPLFAEFDRRRAVLFLHPAGSGTGRQTRVLGLNWMVGAPIEDTCAALHLILGGVTSRFPNVRIVVPHLGGTLPFVIGRIDSQYSPQRGRDLAASPSELARQLWYDTVSYAHLPALRCASETFGTDRLLLGTDYPYAPGDRLRRAASYAEAAGLSPAQVDAIQSGNARELLNLGGRG